MKNHIDKCPKCDSHLEIARYTCPNCGTEIDGEFSGCAFCRLGDEDRLFALIFIQTEGNMKDVERVMGISYPTVKARLSKLNEALAPEAPEIKLKFRINLETDSEGLAPEEKTHILDRLASGEIDAKEAVNLLKGDTNDSDNR